GLGVVYERIVLNAYLLALKQKHNIETVLEAPLYGMAGVSGINSVPLAQAGCTVTLLDDNLERIEGVQRIWRELGLAARVIIAHRQDFTRLPFDDNTFDLVWAWAALWYVNDVNALLHEMARVARRVVFVAMPNRMQIGYVLRKFVLEPNFFRTVDESWANIPRVKKVLRRAGLTIADEGVLDVPPWPDTVMPAALVLQKLGVRSKRMNARFEGDGWQWSTMDYYTGKRPELKVMVERYMFLERLPVPWQFKTIWAHHRYVVGLKNG
ncbi:MAG: methyltransferase domain-containing protein, partial [Chloroflexota bacterium]